MPILREPATLLQNTVSIKKTAKKKGKLIKVSVPITHQQHDKLSAYAKKNYMTIANVFRKFIDNLDIT